MSAAPIPDPPATNLPPLGLPSGTIVQYTIKKFAGQIFVGTVMKNGPTPPKSEKQNGKNQQDIPQGDPYYVVTHSDGTFNAARTSCTISNPPLPITNKPAMGGGYYEKYLKYKQKYLELKNQLNN